MPHNGSESLVSETQDRVKLQRGQNQCIQTWDREVYNFDKYLIVASIR